MPDGGLLIIEHFKDVLKAQNVEGVFHLGRETAYLDVSAPVAHLFDEAHENAQSSGRYVGELFAIDHNTDTTRVDGLLNLILELRGGVGVNKPLDRDDGQSVFDG